MAAGRRGRRRARGFGQDDGEFEEEREGPEVESIDLHGLRSDEALHRVELAVHRARVRGATALHVITGRGWGNREQEPVLRTRIEEWTRGRDARARGVRGFVRTDRDGALVLELAPRG